MSTSSAQPNCQLSAASFEKFCRFITRELGIKMSEAKLPMLQSRLQRRLRLLQLDSLEAYQEYLFQSVEGEAERVHFFDAVTTNKTDFFREPQHFHFLVQTAVPQWQRPGPGRAAETRTFRLWCAGCSTGEEPHTVAMVLAEYAAQQEGFEFSILATDISTRVLAHARRGIYEAARVEPVPAALRPKYLRRNKDPQRAEVRVVPELRAHLEFQRLNFMDSHYEVRGPFDAIFFRNVMIYFDKATQEAVLQKLCRQLRPGGYLFVGHSESLAGLNLPVTSVATATYRKPL